MRERLRGIFGMLALCLVVAVSLIVMDLLAERNEARAATGMEMLWTLHQLPMVATSSTADIQFDLGGVPVILASGTVASGASTATITVTGVDADDRVLAMSNSAGNQAVRQAVPGSGSVAVTMEGNVATDTAITLLIFTD